MCRSTYTLTCIYVLETPYLYCIYTYALYALTHMPLISFNFCSRALSVSQQVRPRKP